MKCEFCTGNMAIEDAVCPHCGRPNPFYEAHRQDMVKYEKQFEKTKYEAIETNVRHTRKAVQVSLVAVLIALILASVIVILSMDDINESMEKSANKKNAQTIVETLQKYEGDRDFYNFETYYYDHQNGIYHEVREFYAVDAAIMYERTIESQLMGMVFGESYMTPSELASTLTNSYCGIMELWDNAAKTPDNEAYSPKHMESCEYLLNDVHTLLKAYCGFTDDEIDALKNQSKAERQLVFEKKIEGIMANEE